MSESFDYKECLTNETLSAKFNNKFDIVAEAIKKAHYFVSSGKEPVGGLCNLPFYVLAQMARESQKKEVQPL